MTLEGTPTRVAWAGARDRFVVCGTEDGALCAWDLDEDQRGDPAHSRAEEDPDSEEEGEASDTAAPAFARRAPGILRGQMHRRPSYTTEGSSFAARGDVAGAVVALAVVAETTPRRATAEATESASAGDAERRRDDAARSGSARPGGFHVLALDCWGRADSYLASEVSERDAADAAVSDPGLRFGSRLRLVPAALDVKYGGTEGARARGWGANAREYECGYGELDRKRRVTSVGPLRHPHLPPAGPGALSHPSSPSLGSRAPFASVAMLRVMCSCISRTFPSLITSATQSLNRS